jgi:hypothetical protein
MLLKFSRACVGMVNLRVVTLSLNPLLLLLGACAAGWNHTSDATLERRFKQHENEFEALVADVQSDPQLTTLHRHTIVYAGR